MCIRDRIKTGYRVQGAGNRKRADGGQRIAYRKTEFGAENAGYFGSSQARVGGCDERNAGPFDSLRMTEFSFSFENSQWFRQESNARSIRFAQDDSFVFGIGIMRRASRDSRVSKSRPRPSVFFGEQLSRSGDGGDGFSAVGAAFGGEGNVGEAFGAGVGGGWRGFRGAEFFEQRVDGEHEDEVDDSGDEEEGNDGVEEVAVLDFAAVDVEDEGGEVGLVDLSLIHI